MRKIISYLLFLSILAAIIVSISFTKKKTTTSNSNAENFSMESTVAVGQAKHSYAISYSDSRHIFFLDKWYVFFNDGEKLNYASSPDGKNFTQPIKVDNNLAAFDFTVNLSVPSEVNILYTDKSYSRIYLARGKLDNEKINFEKTILVYDAKESYKTTAPFLTVTPEKYFITFRSDLGQGKMGINLISSDDIEGRIWHGAYKKISTSDSESDSGAGTSSIIFSPLAGKLVAIWSGSNNLWQGISYDNGSSWNVSLAKNDFRGVHDFSAFEKGGIISLLYRGESGDVNFSRWENDIWSVSEKIGESADLHSLSLTENKKGDILAIYKPTQKNELVYRRLQNGKWEESERFSISKTGYSWTGLAYPNNINDFGVIWLESEKEPFLIKFKTIPSQKPIKGSLVTSNIGEVPNAFAWGFDRHICYDPYTTSWWIFYTKAPGHIVYQNSNDDGNKWSNPFFIDDNQNNRQNPDFTISCKPPYIYVVFSDANQSSILWKKGTINKDGIDWQIATTVNNNKDAWTRVIPSLQFYQGKPFISYHDQSGLEGDGANRRSFVSESLDNDGTSWYDPITLFEKPNATKGDQLTFTSLAQAESRLLALINANQNELWKSEYLGNNKWSTPEYVKELNYGNGIPDWQTLMDSKGTLHIIYPERGTLKTMYATLNQDGWKEIQLSDEKTNRQSALSIDQDDNIYAIYGKLKIRRKINGVWLPEESLLAYSDPNSTQNFTNSTEFMHDDKLGIAWLEGEFTKPSIRFACLQKKYLDPTSSELISCARNLR